MALVAFRCPCGHEFETITGSTIGDPEAAKCPKCGAATDEAERQIAGGRQIRGKRRTLENLTPEERARIDVVEGLEAKAYYEENAEAILSGELKLNEERTIEELRPQVPEHLRKRYY